MDQEPKIEKSRQELLAELNDALGTLRQYIEDDLNIPNDTRAILLKRADEVFDIFFELKDK